MRLRQSDLSSLATLNVVTTSKDDENTAETARVEVKSLTITTEKMPLVVLTGYPSSGKSRVAAEVKNFFEQEKGKTVLIVSENELVGPDRNVVFSDSRQEKTVRDSLKSETVRLLHRDHLIVVDGLNYVKGFRYEIYCASKAAKTPQCTIHCDLSPQDAWILNENGGAPYSKDVFDALVARYEAPVAHNRWDAPLFLALKDRALDMEAIYEAVYLRRAPPPNQSTQCQPLSSAGFLHEADRVMRDIVAAILEAQKSGLASDEVAVPGTEEKFRLESKVTMAQLARIKRQFIVYAKNRAIDNVQKLATTFVQYLNSSLSAGTLDHESSVN